MSEPARIYTPEYYERLKAIEGRHWWTLGMNDIMSALLSGRTAGRPVSCFLDVGCGSGIGLAWAARVLPEARRVGVDVSPHALEHCAGLGAELRLIDGSHLPLPQDAVDIAICVDVLQHVEDEGPLLAEMRRVLRPGGWLYVRTNSRGLGSAPAGSKLFTRAALVERLAAAGFEVAHCSPVNCVGALVATLRSRGGPRERAEHHHHEGDDREGQGRGFEGGGYGGGLALQPEDASRPISRGKRALLALEGRLLRLGLRLPFGHSLVALARKATA